MQRIIVFRGPVNRAIVIIAALAIVLGVVARFAYLDSPLFFKDESMTALFTTGHSYDSYLQLFDGKIHRASDVVDVTKVDESRGPLYAARSIAREDPHHSPLFFMLERLWIEFAGSNVSGYRSLAAVFGVAGIGLMYLLLVRLGGMRAAWIGAALFALSPLFVNLSRDAREYALFVDVVLLATIALLEALRYGTLILWIAYVLAVAIGMYVDSLFVLVAISHGAIVLFGSRTRPRVIVSWAAAAVVGAISFAPWALNALHSERSSYELDWARTPYTLKYSLLRWTFNIGSIAFDGEFRSLKLGFFGVLAAAIVLAAVAYTAWSVRDRRRTIALAITCVTTLALIGIDLVQHAHFETIPRYLSAAWVGVVIAMAIAITTLSEAATNRFRLTVIGAWTFLLILGAASFLIRGPAQNWWENTDDVAYQAVARVVDVNPQALVIIEDRDQVALELCRYLDPHTRVLLLQESRNVASSVVAPAFLIVPTADLRRAVARERVSLENVSPRSTSVVSGFRDARASTARDDVAAYNAVWYVRAKPLP